MKRLTYILSIILLAAVNAVAQYDYRIDVVCPGAELTYRINGEEESTWEWMMYTLEGEGEDEVRIEIPLDNPEGTNFQETDNDDNLVFGSEITIEWDVPPGIYYLSV